MFCRIMFCAAIVISLASAFDFSFIKNSDVDVLNETTNLSPIGGLDPSYYVVDEWFAKCENDTGLDIRNATQVAVSSTVACVASLINIGNLPVEIAFASELGKLNEVFQRRCNLLAQIKDCRKDLVNTLKLCMSEQNQMDFNVLLNAADRGLDYACYNGGERLALLMAEDAVNCLGSQSGIISSCLNSGILLLKQTWMTDLQELNATQSIFTKNTCELENRTFSCAEDNLNKCKDPTAAKLVGGFMKAMIEETPCFKNSSTKTYSSPSVALAVTFYYLFSKHFFF